MSFVPCRIARVPDRLHAAATAAAIDHNPHNALRGVAGPVPQHLTSMVGKLWQPGTVLRVAFLGRVGADLADRVVDHMNAWHDKGVGVRFVRSTWQPQVRVTLTGSGYWSYIGTDILAIPAGQPTMCLEGFSDGTPESEFVRVVRHETGHTLGFPHEHSRPEIVAGFDPEKTIAYYGRWQGWDAATVREQILDPLTSGSYTGTAEPDRGSIMCYPFPSACLKPGAAPVPGGVDLTPRDVAYARRVYPGRNRLAALYC